MTITDRLAAKIRTWTPMGVGAVLAWLEARYGVHIDSVPVAMAVTAIAGAAYYWAVTELERRWPVLGRLLGRPGAPSYASGSLEGDVAPAGKLLIEVAVDAGENELRKAVRAALRDHRTTGS